MHFQKQFLLASLLLFALGCKKPVVVPDAASCDLTGIPFSSTDSYDFDADLDQTFIQSTRWESSNASLALEAGKGVLTANSSNTRQALEAWRLYKDQMPSGKSWEISAEVTVPLHWNGNGGRNAQVGIGLFVGKPVASGQSSKVYECNFAAVNGGERFVQAQLIANRLGEDPIDVQRIVLDQALETLVLKIQYCAAQQSLGLFADGKQVGASKAISESGGDDWALGAGGLMDVGIMGFAEKTTITSHSPSIDRFSVTIY